MSDATRELLEIIRRPGALDDDLRRRLAEALTAPRWMAYEEFLAWADEDTHAEWVKGEVIMTSPASGRHQDISDFLTSVLRSFVEAHHLGIFRSAPFQMRLEYSGREPDLIFVAAENLARLKETHLDGPADLVIEITSPESDTRDRGGKFTEYEQAGIPEYWLIDPEREQAVFYQRDEAGRYRSILPDENGIYHSKALPGFWLRESWFWKIPPVLDTLRELGLV